MKSFILLSVIACSVIMGEEGTEYIIISKERDWVRIVTIISEVSQAFEKHANDIELKSIKSGQSVKENKTNGDAAIFIHIGKSITANELLKILDKGKVKYEYIIKVPQKDA